MKEIEDIIDENIRNLKLLNVPIRPLLSFLFYTLDALFVGNRFIKNKKGNIEEYRSLQGRLPDIIKTFINSPNYPIGESVLDCIGFISEQDDLLDEIQSLLKYGQFCELMPEFHRKKFNVKSNNNVFQLEYKSKIYEENEAIDILLSELSLEAFVPRIPSQDRLDSYYHEIINFLPNVKSDLVTQLTLYIYQQLSTNIIFENYIYEKNLKDSFGFGLNDFSKVRMSLLSYSIFSLHLAELLEKKYHSSEDNKIFEKEILEWIAQYIKEDFVLFIVHTLTKLPIEVIKLIIEFFTLNLNKKDNIEDTLKDGFTYPFFKLDDSLIFSPHLIRDLFNIRNFLFLVNIKEKTIFNNKLSKDLEPHLIDKINTSFNNFTNLEIHLNKKYSGGEFDLIIYDGFNLLNMQVKATMAPHGHRMIKQTDDRVKEGINQINNFANKSLEEKQSIISNIFSKNIDFNKIYGLVVTISCLGTYDVTSQFNEDIQGINFKGLEFLLKKINNSNFIVESFITEVIKFKKELLETSKARWRTENLDLFGFTVEYPMLNFDSTFKYHFI